ncbi:MAG: hypothetical protein HWN68_12430 [Desulfobacterales bacterium]|nr:hypothetical protein [Desulfobacterales bacterium]
MKKKEACFFSLPTFLFLLFLFSPQIGLAFSAETDPYIVVDWTYVRDERLDVEGLQAIGFHLVWSTNSSAVRGAIVFINNKPYETDNSGIVLFTDTSQGVTKKEWSINRIVYYGKEFAFEQNVANPYCIFDKVLIELATSKPRIGIETEANIIWTAKYAYDNSPFKGQILLNNSQLAYSTVGRRAYTVDSILDEKYGLTAYDSNSIDIIWDRVNIYLSTITRAKTRIDVGSEADIHWYGIYAHDITDFKGDIEFNDTLIKNMAGKYCFTVKSINDQLYNIDSFLSNNVEFIYDEIIIRLNVKNKRIDIGEKTNISWTGKYAYDSEPFTGKVILDDNVLQYDTVGCREYVVKSVIDRYYNLKAFSSNRVGVIWDRVNIELKAEDERINVGEEANIWWRGVYEYDRSDFNEIGKVRLNSTKFERDTVGVINYEVLDIEDYTHSLTNYTSNILTVIWDRVNVNLAFPHNRIQVGTEANPNVNATYEYDGTIFDGIVQLNDTLAKKGLGKYTYTVTSIHDPKYGITNFVSNKAVCTFDRISLEKRLDSKMPGKVQILFNLVYESDNSPIENAFLQVNDKSVYYLGDGNYVIIIFNWFPWFQIEAQVTCPGFATEMFTEVYYCVGNIGVFTSITIMSVLLSSFVIRKRKMTVIEMKILQTLESGGEILFTGLSNKFKCSSKKIAKITKRALQKGKISGVLTFDKAGFISESELRLKTKYKDSSTDELFRSIQQINTPKINTVDPQIGSITKQFFREETTLIENNALSINYLDRNGLYLEEADAPTFIPKRPLVDAIFAQDVLCPECKGFGWRISKETIRSHAALKHLNRLSKCLRCQGQGFLELSSCYLRHPVYLEASDIEAHLLKKETLEIEERLNIQEKRFEVGKRILEFTPRFILDFDPTLQDEEIIFIAPGLFSDEELKRLNIVNGAVIPKRPSKRARTKHEKSRPSQA